MFVKIKRFTTNYIIANIRDVRFLGLIALGVLVLLTSWSGVRIIEINYDLQKEIAGLEARNEVRKLENDNLKLKNQYLATDTYLELTARQQFGKGGMDEKLILVPKEIALARAPKLSEKKSTSTAAEVEKPAYLKNIYDWRDFFLRRSVN